MIKKSFTLMIAVLFISGCSLVPDYRRPDVTVPSAWHETDSQSGVAVDPQWWAQFDSKELNRLMRAAHAHNNNIQAGMYRIEQSRAALKAAGAPLLPTVGASAGTSRSYSNPAGGASDNNTSLRTGASVSYELDLFGANRAGRKAAEAALAGTLYNEVSLRLVISGDVARNYFNILNLRNRVQIAESNLDILREVLRIIETRYNVGTESALEVSRQRSALASAEASKVSLVRQLANAENAFAVLLGVPPGNIGIEKDDLAALKIPDIAAGQPSTLLERRPDIRAAEAGLIAANANIGMARAAFFPSVTIGLDGGLAAAGYGDPFGSSLSLAAALTAPIFQGGRLEAGLESATARQRELAENYQQAILTALEEAENALVAVKSAATREEELALALDEARKSYELTRLLYDAGRIDFQNLLDVQRTLLSAEDSFAQSKYDRLAAAIDLYLALGGGWNGQSTAGSEQIP